MAIENIEGLKPMEVWRFFSEICDIPRPSKHEERVIAYLKEFAESRSLEYDCDSVGNMVIRKAATAGKEASPIITLQAHMDMVAEKQAGLEFNFLTDPISAYVEDGWLKARGTTLGADCGIGMAVMLALLDADSIAHPALEALFTVDEETGLTGAFALSTELLKGNYMINVDSEDKGEIFIGCAGGIDSVAHFAITREASKHNSALKISISGLMGGHSGDDINKRRANANILLSRVLYDIMQGHAISIAAISGGNLRNAIPRDAEALITADSSSIEAIEAIVKASEVDFVGEFSPADPDIKVSLTKEEMPESVIEDSVAKEIVGAVLSAINGITAMSQQMADFVESSTNLASIKEVDGKIIISTSQRSSLESKKHFMAKQMALHFKKFGAEVIHSDGYPGWNPQTDSRLLELAITSHKEALGYEPKVRAIHAGLECGLIKEKYPAMEMISIGPTIMGAHSPSERLSVADTEEFWRYISDLLGRL